MPDAEAPDGQSASTRVRDALGAIWRFVRPDTILQSIVAGLIVATVAGVGVTIVTVSRSGPSRPTTTPTRTTAPSSLASAPAWLDGMSPTGGRLDFPSSSYPGPFTVSGHAIPHTVGFFVSPGSPGQVIYDIGGHYTTLIVDFSIGDQDNVNPVHFDILGDGSSLLSGGVDATPAARTVRKTVTVTGVRQLSLTASTTTTGSVQALFGSAEVMPSLGTPIETTTAPSSLASAPAWLDGMSPTGGRLDFPSSSYPGPFTVSGHAIPHTVGFFVSPGSPGQVIYDIGGHYTTLIVDFSIGDQDNVNPVHFDILGDGSLLLSGGVDATPAARTVRKTVTVTGVHQLSLTASTTTTGSVQALFGRAEVVP